MADLECLAGSKVAISSSHLELLQQVLSDLTPDETKDYESLRTLLEPFLLDAMKQGRQSPHDAKSDRQVEILCRQIFEELSAKTLRENVKDGKCWEATLSHALTVAQKRALGVDLSPEIVGGPGWGFPQPNKRAWPNGVRMVDSSNGLLFSSEVNDTAIRAVAANKRFIVLCAEDNNARVFDTKGTLLQTLQTAQKTRNVAIFDRYVATGEKNGMGELFDLGEKKKSGSLLCTLQSKGKVSVTMYNVDICSKSVILSSSRPYGMKADEKDKRLQVAQLYNWEGTLQHSFVHGAMIGRMGICVSEDYAATSGEDQVVKVWSTKTGELVLQLPAEKGRSPGVRFKNHQLYVSGSSDVAVYTLPSGTLERRLDVEAAASPSSPSSPNATNASGTLRATPLTYPRLALAGNYVVSASETRVATVWTLLDGKPLCSIVDERRISGDFYAAVGGDRLVLIAGKMLKIYDLTVHSGYKRAYSESLGMSLDYLIDPTQFTQVAQTATGQDCPSHGLLGCGVEGSRPKI
eukprot:s1669_g7.t1